MQVSTAFIVSEVSPARHKGEDYEGGTPHQDHTVCKFLQRHSGDTVTSLFLQANISGHERKLPYLPPIAYVIDPELKVQ